MSLFQKSRTRFFSAKLEPSCGYCENGTPTQDGSVILCTRQGVVSPGFSCKKFRYDPISRKVRPLPPLPTYSPEDFLL